MYSSNRKLASVTTAVAMLLTATQANAQPKPDIDPPVWVVSDHDTTIYMFGTHHVPGDKAEWFNDEVLTAFEKADEVVVEATDLEEVSKDPARLTKYVVRSDGKLSDDLTPDYQAKLAATLAKLGAPSNALDQMTPFMAALTLLQVQSGEQPDPAKAPDVIIQKRAAAKGMKIVALESAIFQLEMFAQLSREDQVRMLESTLDGDDIAGELAKMYDIWSRGDASALAAMIDEGSVEEPVFHRVTFTDRNRTWTDWIVKRMEQPGTVFMAAGAGHFVGKDSVLKMLGDKGILSKRLRP